MEAVRMVAGDAVGQSALRKAMWRLIPLIALGYGTSFMDRSNISFASLQMNRDLHFSATMYGFGAGVFFWGYAICEVPANLMLCKLGARRWLAAILLVWGVLAMAMMLVRTPVEFYGMRFVLGMAEAGFFPGAIFYLSRWFPREMRARAISGFYIAWPLSSVLMGAIAGWLLGLQGKLGLAGWQWLFLIEGLPAVLLCGVFWRLLPDGPRDAKWLTTAERGWLETELAKDAASGTTVDAGHVAEVFRVMLHPQVLLMGLLMLCSLTCNYGYVLTAPAILQQVTGFNVKDVGYLLAWMTLLGAPVMLLTAYTSDRYKERHWHVIVPFVLMAAGYAVSGRSHNMPLVVAALTIAGLSSYALQSPLWAAVASFFEGRQGAVAIAAVTMMSILGGFVGPMIVNVEKDRTGSYQMGLLWLVVPSVLGAVMMLGMKIRSKADHGLHG